MKNVIKSSLAAVVLTVQRRGQWQWSGVRKSICRSHFRSSNSGNKKETWIPQHWSDIDMSGYYISTKRRGRICGIIYESLALSNLWTMKSLSWHAIQTVCITDWVVFIRLPTTRSTNDRLDPILESFIYLPIVVHISHNNRLNEGLRLSKGP